MVFLVAGPQALTLILLSGLHYHVICSTYGTYMYF